MDTSLVSRISQKLPNFITLFFSISLVSGFKVLSDHYHFTTAPVYSFATWGDTLLLCSFFVTLFFIVTAWIGYNVLVERDPYSFDLVRFFFDVFRFAVMYSLLSWSFLAEKPAHYYVFIFGMAFYHLLLTLWYTYDIMVVHSVVKHNRRQDIWPHGIVAVIYLVLGFLYLSAVNGAANETAGQQSHNLITAITLAVVAFWSLKRLRDLRKRIKKESDLVQQS